MKNFNYLILVILLLSCNTNNRKESLAIENISIDVAGKYVTDMSEIIQKIELIPLQTDTNCLVSAYKKATYCKEKELFILLDKELVVSIFSANGKFISSSKSKQGKGPEEYMTAVDVIYNPFSESIEILDPYGTIYRYDEDFKFKEKITLNQTDIIFSRFIPTELNQYMLTPVMMGEEDAIIYFCDYDKKEFKQTVNYKEGYISSLAMNYNPFFKVNEESYFSPLCLDYNFYKIDEKDKTITPTISLNFGNKDINKKNLIDKFGNSSNSSKDRESIESTLKIVSNTNNYLLNSEYPLPIIKFFNEKYIYAHILTNQKHSNFIYNRKKQLGYLQTSQSPFNLFFCLEIDNNALIALVNPFEIDQYINKKYLTKESLQILDQLNEEDNPLIVKYYLQ